jgi:hypothetical protein
MMIIGCDFHTRFQQIAMLDPTTGEVIIGTKASGYPSWPGVFTPLEAGYISADQLSSFVFRVLASPEKSAFRNAWSAAELQTRQAPRGRIDESPLPSSQLTVAPHLFCKGGAELCRRHDPP